MGEEDGGRKQRVSSQRPSSDVYINEAVIVSNRSHHVICKLAVGSERVKEMLT
jgi:hypothetical protein